MCKSWGKAWENLLESMWKSCGRFWVVWGYKIGNCVIVGKIGGYSTGFAMVLNKFCTVGKVDFHLGLGGFPCFAQRITTAITKYN
jgi:hypothetical protein